MLRKIPAGEISEKNFTKTSKILVSEFIRAGSRNFHTWRNIIHQKKKVVMFLFYDRDYYDTAYHLGNPICI